MNEYIMHEKPIDDTKGEFAITSRDDLFLAKIAGRDVDISTMTPPVAVGTTEKLMLEIADRIDEIEEGSGGESQPFIVTFTFDKGSGTYSSDKTYEQISGALEQDKFVFARSSQSPSKQIPLVNGGSPIRFAIMDMVSGQSPAITYEVLSIASDNIPHYHEYSIAATAI